MSRRVLVLGGAGFVGRRIVAVLSQDAGWQVRVASRHARPAAGGVEVVRADATDAASLGLALAGCDAVVNCVTGSSATITQGAHGLAQALQRLAACTRVVHLSSMAAYGDIEGQVDDATPLGGGGGWYAQAKREAEATLRTVATAQRALVVLRPGCVHGPGSHLWVERFGRWLQAGRLGDLGAAGDGWSNLVHVDDVAATAVAALNWQATVPVLAANVAPTDSPRWNVYMVALAQAISAVPVRRVPGWQLRLDAGLAAVPLRVWERLAPRFGLHAHWAPPAMAPSLLRLLQQDRRLVSVVAGEELGVRWTPFADGVQQSAAWFKANVR